MFHIKTFQTASHRSRCSLQRRKYLPWWNWLTPRKKATLTFKNSARCSLHLCLPTWLWFKKMINIIQICNLPKTSMLSILKIRLRCRSQLKTLGCHSYQMLIPNCWPQQDSALNHCMQVLSWTSNRREVDQDILKKNADLVNQLCLPSTIPSLNPNWAFLLLLLVIIWMLKLLSKWRTSIISRNCKLLELNPRELISRWPMTLFIANKPILILSVNRRSWFQLQETTITLNSVETFR